MLTASRTQSITSADTADTLVYFVPREASARTHPGHYTIYTDHHAFDPGAMAIPLGSTISFVNLDSVDHNVFSVTPGSAFNLGYQSHGQTASHTFEHAGLVLISCNVHPGMKVDVLVEPTPFVATVAADGSFVMRGVPAGPGTLYAWNPRARIASQPISVPREAPVQLQLTVTRPRVETTLYTGKQP